MDSATRNVSGVIARLKRLFAPDSLTSKYRHELFHVGPVYHRVLPASTSRLLVMDADLRFHADVADLYQEFNQFSTTELMALAPEMSPLYFASFSKHRRTFGSKLGLHDSYPGLNSGIVLYHLTNMRTSAEYNALLDSEGALEELCDQYGHYRGAKVGDQDLFTLLGAARPDWVRMLDCGWNVQLDESMKTHPMFDLYHQCNSDVKLLHGNGGSIIPEM
ncbi:hypothetical protein B566_EDAN014034 [Ephemera danica]|nr:hypothetical protein B566_EDAN014034 [Ephemera danica]